MRIESLTVEEKSFTDGTLTAALDAELPQSADCARMTEYYRKFGENLAEWFCRELSAYAKAEYEISDDERKKWRWRPAVMTVRFASSESDGAVRIDMRIALDLPQKGRAFRKRIFVWSADGKRVAVKDRSNRKKRRGRGAGLLTLIL